MFILSGHGNNDYMMTIVYYFFFFAMHQVCSEIYSKHDVVLIYSVSYAYRSFPFKVDKIR